jgi:hypothetical protein
MEQLERRVARLEAAFIARDAGRRPRRGRTLLVALAAIAGAVAWRAMRARAAVAPHQPSGSDGSGTAVSTAPSSSLRAAEQMGPLGGADAVPSSPALTGPEMSRLTGVDRPAPPPGALG